MKRIYVAGPITIGDQFLNVVRAIKAAEELRAVGLFPFVPHLSALWHMIAPVPYEEWLVYDFAWIDACDALLRIPGESGGADREATYAASTGKPVFLSVSDVLRWAGVEPTVQETGGPL